jgi:hypothetical protein
MGEVDVTCPECPLQAKVLPREDQMIDTTAGKCPHRSNRLNCQTMRQILSVGRQELMPLNPTNRRIRTRMSGRGRARCDGPLA